MPRTFSGPDRTKSQATRVYHVLRAEVMDVDGSWQDLRDLGMEGINVLVGASISTTVDELVWRASVRVRLSSDEEGTSPLIAASLFNRDGIGVYSPLLTPGAQIRVHADTLAPGTGETDDTKRLMFWGRIDRADFASDPMTLTCRDLGGKLLDTIVREDRTYGDPDAPVPAADVMQQFLTDNADILGESITLSVPETPTYLVTEFHQVGVSVLDALNTLAQLFGWVVRYAFDDADAFTLTLYDPQRDRTIPSGGDYTVAPTEYHAVDAASLDVTNVRNRLKGWYRDGVTGEAASVEVRDDGSIAAFGERFEQFGGELLLPIDNGNDMLTFLQFALADLSTPPFDHTVSTFFLHFVSLGDVPEFSGNAVHYDEPQQLAVVGITHEFPDGGQGPATTALACRGTPSGAYKRWLRFRGGPVFPDIPPAPILDFLVAEATQFGGTRATVDGAVWPGYRMPKGVDELRFHALLGDGPNLGVPNIDATTLGPIIRRPEGDIGATDEYASIAIMSTDPDLWKRLLFYGVRGGLTSKPVIPAAIQAVDPSPVPLDGTIASLVVTRDGDTNTVTVTPGTLEPTLGENYVCIARNKHILPPILIGTSTAPVVFPDSGLEPSAAAAYAYEAFIANIGATWCVTGGRRSTIVEAPTIVPPVFANGTPIAASVGGLRKIQIDWTAATPGAGAVRVEASTDGVAVRVVGQGLASSGTVYDTVLGPKLYRLVALNIITVPATELAFSEWKWFTGLENPLSNPGALPTFVNATPKARLAGNGATIVRRLVVQWSCATPGGWTMHVQRATAGSGGPFTDVPNGVSASVRSGEWVSPDATWVDTEGWFRLQVYSGLASLLATSTVVHYVPT